MPAVARTALIFSEKKDEKRVRKWVNKLTPELWENFETGNGKKGWTEKEDGADKTRVVGGACIFHNSEDFSGGYGCALHHLAEQEGVSFIETKPDVCWQLPLRRSYDNVTYEDGRERSVVVLGEYDRRGWGAGGADFEWYCTGNTEAHTASEPRLPKFKGRNCGFDRCTGLRGACEIVPRPRGSPRSI